MMKPIKILVMSVGVYEQNGTAKWLEKLGAVGLGVICLPKCFSENADSYRDRGFEVYIYDEEKYIGKDVEYFGFKPRNCGGIGRQGIAEAVEKYGDEYICFELDDDTGNYAVKTSKGAKSIKTKKELEDLVYALYKFSESTGIDIAGKTGATPPKDGSFIANRKIFNNFLMHKGVSTNFWGFAALCSDDYRYNLYHNIIDKTPTVSIDQISITFTQNQGDRKDGNAVIYNGDYSWKKSYSLKMMCPWGAAQRVKHETNRVLFRENFLPSKIYPPICIVDKDQNIIGRL